MYTNSIGYEALLVRWKNGIRNSPDNFLSEKLTFIRPVKGPDDEDNDSDDDGNSMSFMDIDDGTIAAITMTIKVALPVV